MDSNQTVEYEKVELEDQFILRLPIEEAAKLRKILKDKPEKIKKMLKIDLNIEENKGIVHIGKKKLYGVLKKLPTIVDSYKTNICNNKSDLCKTADICHMLECTYVEQENTVVESPNGLTPPLKNVKNKRFRKTMINVDQAMEVDNIMKELYYLLRTDVEAVSTTYKIIYDNNTSVTPDEVSLFGHLSSDSETSSNA